MIMGMKPFQLIVIGVFAFLAIAGLYVFATTTGSGSKTSVGTVTIWGTLPGSEMESTINVLKSSNKDYANVSYVEKPADGFDAALSDAIASGAGPDLVIITQEQLLTETPKLTLIPFSSISQRTFLDTYVGEDQLYLTSTGTYGIPLVIDPLVLYYNRTMLSSAGVASAPTTWEAVTGLASVLTKKSGGQIGVSAVPFGSYANVSNARAILSALLLQAGSSVTTPVNGSVRSAIGDRNTAAGNTGATPAVAAFNFYTQFGNPAKTVYSWNPSLPSSRQAFVSGDLALYPGYASEVSDLKAANPNLDFDMAALPQAGAGARATYGLAYAFVIPKAAINKSGAYTTALALTNSAILPTLAASLHMAPAARSMLVADPNDPYQDVFYPEALTAKGWLSPAPSAVDTVFAAIIQNIVTGKLGTADALTAGDASLNAAL